MGPGGFSKTPIEEISPVSFDLKQDRRRGSLAEVIGIDISGSMAASAGSHTKLELANEAALCLRYYTVTFRGRRPEAVIASGDEAREPGLSEALGSALGAPGQVGRPLEGVEPGEQSGSMDRRGDMAEWAAAVGLTLREDENARAATPEGEAARNEESAERITDLPARGISSNAAARARREAA